MAQTATVQDTRRRRAVVTGASTGLGAVFATALARQQYDLTIVARSRERLEALAGRLRQSYGIATEVIVADLTQPTALRTVEEHVAGDNALELLVNNAGFGTTGPFARLDPDQEEAEICLNVLALVRLTRAALPGMIARGRGAIINVSSLAAFAPGPYDATYGATKAFVNSFTEALHEELCGTGVHVQTLCPGFTYTEFQQRAGIDISKIPTCAWMTPEAVVEASLRALQRRQVVCVPGLGNRLLALLMGAAPRRLVRRVAGILAYRILGGDGYSGLRSEQGPSPLSEMTSISLAKQEDTMAEQPSYQHRVPKTVINVLTLEPGTRVRLVGDALADVVANPQDGVWLLLRYVAAPGNPDQVGVEEMVFAEDVLEVIETSG